MLIKVITCKVKEEFREAFYEEQKIWSALSPLYGFLGQTGGWSTKNPLKARIFAFWEDQKAYQYFMDHVHDEVLINSKQDSTHESIVVSLYKEVVKIPGSEKNMIQTLEKGGYVRTASTQVKHKRVNDFIRMQQTVWNPGMGEAEGMLGGTFAVSEKRKGNFLVFSCWKDGSFHRTYMEDHFPGLIAAARPQYDVEDFVGEEVRIEEDWIVLPTQKRL
jgi:quinol monooxygenase YgiN